MSLLKQELLRKIPSVNRLLEVDELQNILDLYPQDLVVDLINQVLAEKRQVILEGHIKPEQVNLSIEKLASEIKKVVEKYMAPRLRKVINATGTILHTNLGRSLLSNQAADALALIARTYSNLEYDLEEGKRGSRYTLVTDLLCRLTGSEDAIVVNNNAAAVLLILNTIAKGQEVILSRGELVEIGGSFRMHEVMNASGCKLVEVGSTNKTHLTDYEAAITPETGLIAKVHTSNFQIVGFTQTVENVELKKLAQKYQIPFYEDLGSGVLVNLEKYGITHEPTVLEAVLAGVDLVSFSGDKLLGGPQAGIVVGKKEYISQLKKNHLIRALRVDKFTLAALEVTLKHYLNEVEAIEQIPTLQMIKLSAADILERAEQIASILQQKIPALKIRIIIGTSMVGGGSLPLEQIPTHLLGVKFSDISTTDLSIILRKRRVPIICRIQDDELLFDLRTVSPKEEQEIIDALNEIANT